MQAFVIDTYKDGLAQREMPDPSPRPGDVVVAIQARLKAKRRGVDYSFLFVRADGKQLSEIARLVDSGVIRPVIDGIFPSSGRRTPSRE